MVWRGASTRRDTQTLLRWLCHAFRKLNIVLLSSFFHLVLSVPSHQLSTQDHFFGSFVRI